MTQPDPVSRENWSGTSKVTLAETAIPQLDAARQRTVRLIISIPVLFLLTVLGSGTFLYIYLVHMVDLGRIDPEIIVQLERTPGRHQTAERLRLESQRMQSRTEAVALNILLISIAISIVGSIVGFILARAIVKPIRDITETMDAIAAGDFTTKLAPISLGEFGQLGSSFNHMVQQLNQLFEERDRQLRESFSGAHILLDTTGLVLQADHAARRIIGEDATDMVGLNILDATLTVALFRANPRLRDALQELVAEALSGHPAARSVLVRHPEGGASRYLVTTLKLEGRSPQEDQVLLEVRDITGMAGFYEQIQRADRLAAVGTLATGIAHEIRNPLASIRGMVQLLAEAGPEGVGSSTEYTTRILREVDRLEKLISGIMDFANKEGSPPEEVDINALLTEVVESARLHVGGPAMEVALIWELDSSLPKAILQAERIRQALLNLMVNAFQHCVSKVPKGPIRIQTIHLAVNQQRPIIICLSNPAEALDEIARERIFEPFYTTKPEGTGLGLPIAYQTVASNGGILEVECEGGEIQFWVRLPTESPRSKTASRILPRIRRDPVRTPEE